MNPTNDHQDTIIEKIIKLQAHGESAKMAGNLEEAESFLGKAQELIFKHQIDEAKIREANGLSVKLVLAKKDIKDKDEAGMPWRSSFLHILSKNNFCYSVWMKDEGKCYIWGEKDMVDTVLYLYENLSYKMYLWAKYAYLSDLNDEVTDLSRNKYIKDWLLGAVTGFAKKLNDQKEAAEKASPSLTGLILTNKEALVKAAEQRIGPTTTGKARTDYDRSVFNKGFNKGKEANANKALGGTNQESGYHKKAAKMIG
jgi:hypothetical protein